jgi:hypothetical protein
VADDRAATGTGTGATAAESAGGEPVEHHERTETPGEERERHFERNEQGEVVRDEEYQEPRR